MRLSISKKFVLALLAIGFFVFAGYIAIIHYGEQNYINRETEHTKDNLISARRLIQANIEKYNSVINAISEELEWEGLSGKSSEYILLTEEKDEIAGHFQSFCTGVKSCLRISYITANGNEVIATEKPYGQFETKIIRDNELNNVKDAYYFKEAIKLRDGAVYVSSLDLFTENGKIEEPYVPTIRFIKPVYDSSDNVDGLLLINFYGQELIDLIRSIDDEYSLLDKNFDFIIHPNNSLYQWGAQLGSPYHASIYEVDDKSFFDLKDVKTNETIPLSLDMFDKDGIKIEVNTTSGEFNSFIVIPYDVDNPDHFWVLGKNISLEKLLIGYGDFKNRIIFLFSIFIVILVFIMLITSFSISTPIKQLLNTVLQIRMKNYNIDFPKDENDEIGKLAKELKNLVEDVRRQKKTRSDFITSISHQLPTPIARIRIELNSLEQQIQKLPNNSGAMEVIKNIRQDNELSVKLANDILELIEIGESYRAIRKEDIHLKGIVTSIFNSFKDGIGRKRLNFKINIKDDFIVMSEEYRIKSVIFNILENAVWYSNRGSLIDFTASENEKEVIIMVQNTGIGISDKDKIHIFDRFFRAQNAYLKKTIGTGLGLSIAKIIVEGHGGKIWFESMENEGATFYISLPKK